MKTVVISAEDFNGMVSKYEAAVALATELFAEVKELKRSRLLNLEQVAAKFGIDEGTVSYYEKKGLIPYRIASRGPMWKEGEIDDWVLTRPVNFHRREKQPITS